MITQTSEYALRAVMVLALNRGGLRTTAEVAHQADIPSGYLSKVLRTLAGAGILTARRGIGGGFTLARNPDEITLLAVLEAVDHNLSRTRTTRRKQPEHPALRALDQALTSFNTAMESTLGSTTIQALIDQSTPQRGADIAAPSNKTTAQRAGTRPDHNPDKRIIHR